MAAKSEPDVRYTVFVRVPFPRGGFQDPPIVNWNGNKDQELWKTLSSTPKGTEIDCMGWAVRHSIPVDRSCAAADGNLKSVERFDVALPFLLQQAAWLYARQLSQVREQLRRAKPSTGNSPTPTPISGSTTATVVGGSYAMRRGGSGGGSRGPSSLSVRPRGSLELRNNNDGSAPTTPIQGRMPYSRTASTNTVTQVPRSSATVQSALGTSPKQQRRSLDSENRESRLHSQEASHQRSSVVVESSSSSSPSSSEDDAPISHSRAFSRRPRFSGANPKGKARLGALSSADEDDDDDSPAFLPFSATGHRTQQPQGTREATNSKAQIPVRTATATDPLAAPPSTSTSSSPGQPSSSAPSISSNSARPANAFSSPPTNAALAALSPRQRRLAQAGSESAGTPSMGSSFSDLDDASVTQSALEEALAREIKAGKGSIGVVGRMGGLWKQGMGGAGGQGAASSKAG